jgi:hypothetical protein
MQLSKRRPRPPAEGRCNHGRSSESVRIETGRAGLLLNCQSLQGLRDATETGGGHEVVTKVVK